MSSLPNLRQLQSVDSEISLALSDSANRQILARHQEEVQTELEHEGLSQATIDAQQELSDLFGIPTFDVTGSISTVPESGEFNPDIDVGTGKFNETVFEASKNALTQKEPTLISFGATFFNDTLIKPISDAFDSLFQVSDLSDLTDEQRQKIEAINSRIARLEKALQPLKDDLEDLRRQFAAATTDFERIRIQTRINALRNTIIAEQIPIDNLISERDELLRTFRAVKDFTKILIDRTDELNDLINKIPFTATDKAALSNLISQSSKLIEEILIQEVDVAQSDITSLQVALQAAAFKLQSPISETQGALDGILDGATDALFGFGAALAEGFAGFAEIFASTLTDLFDLSPDKLAESTNFVKDYISTQQKEAEG